jgi:D-glycero-alpha-D-manno-heptose 1-phosphate guanylyltransferase
VTETRDAEKTPAILLVGGLGTRLRSVLPTTPKPLAKIGDAPFLELLILQLRAQGFRHLIMSTGHLAEQIHEELGNGSKWDIRIEFSQETTPLGTAGAVKLAEGYLGDASDFLVMNGDSFLEMNLRELVQVRREHDGIASMAVREVPDAARYGTVRTNSSHQVIAFEEKTGRQAPGTINGGVYAFSRTILERIPQGRSNFEQDVFPKVLDEGIYAIEQHGMFIDIGTPEDYARAQTIYSSLRQAVHSGASEKEAALGN